MVMVEILRAVVLGVVQGVTEFLPISSSAHLILVPRWLGWPDQGLPFDVAVHGGTLVALIVYFRQDLVRATQDLLGRRSLARPTDGGAPAGAPLAGLLILGTVPVAVAGLLLQDVLATSARDPGLIGWTLLGFGLLLGIADRWGRQDRAMATAGWWDAAVVGLAQTLALMPGTSRSGITLTAGLARRFDRSSAARFSFLLSIPATGLAFAKDVWDATQGRVPLTDLLPMAAGLAAAAISGYAVIRWLLRWVAGRSLLPFVVYRLILGVALLLGLAG